MDILYLAHMFYFIRNRNHAILLFLKQYTYKVIIPITHVSTEFNKTAHYIYIYIYRINNKYLLALLLIILLFINKKLNK